MKLLKILAFCDCGYLWLGVLFGYEMGTVPSEPFPLTLVAFAAYDLLLTLCCILSIRSAFWAATISWVGALVYLLISWRIDANWVFRANLSSCLWAPALLALAASVERTRPADRRTE